eukprot:1161824-Pelagomonas_calceolata.AAC.8
MGSAWFKNKGDLWEGLARAPEAHAGQGAAALKQRPGAYKKGGGKWLCLGGAAQGARGTRSCRPISRQGSVKEGIAACVLLDLLDFPELLGLP